MTKHLALFVFIALSFTALCQSIDDPFSTSKMKKDLQVFKEIREEANSGLYKYRTKQEIDSIYEWAESEIQNLSTYRDFYNLISTLSDFEGSLHNTTSLPKKYVNSWQNEKSGYFPFPVKWIENKWIVNHDKATIPLGAEITSINDVPISAVIVNLYKYFTTDGVNVTGKRIGIGSSFSIFYRYNYGLKDFFKVTYRAPKSNIITSKEMKSVGFIDYYRKYKSRYSYSFDRLKYEGAKQDEKYLFHQINEKTGLLTLNTFDLGDSESKEHLVYKKWLDNVFITIKENGIENLIVDVRNNGGGTDPNDVLTYSYLTDRSFQESKEVWISFKKVPFLKYYDSPFPRFLRPLGVGRINRYYQKRFPIEKDGKFYMSKATNEMKRREPNANAFNGKIYLLLSPRVASAGSLFAAMVAGNKTTISIGEETMGGYYGHNGHTPFAYILPKSKIAIEFFIDNMEQDVVKKANQFYNRGIIPDYEVPQTFEDYLGNEDTQMQFVLELIGK